MRPIALAWVSLMFVAVQAGADDSSFEAQGDSYFDAIESDSLDESEPKNRSFEMAMQFVSYRSAVHPMIGPSFVYAYDSLWELGFRGMFSTKAESGATGLYSGLAFVRYSFDNRSAHFFIEPGIGFIAGSGAFDLAGEAQVGFEAPVSRSISIGAATGIDFGVNQAAAPKLMAMTAYRF
ncbi:MAG TPA: hypothetical protein VM598_08580 [Bdellovibrionota bacterium]|nr:hypothetical protein [Bdellovibrionota bacterium]